MAQQSILVIEDDDSILELMTYHQVKTLCQKLGDKMTCIETVRRIGYRFKDQEV